MQLVLATVLALCAAVCACSCSGRDGGEAGASGGAGSAAEATEVVPQVPVSGFKVWVAGSQHVTAGSNVTIQGSFHVPASQYAGLLAIYIVRRHDKGREIVYNSGIAWPAQADDGNVTFVHSLRAPDRLGDYVVKIRHLDAEVGTTELTVE